MIYVTQLKLGHPKYETTTIETENDKVYHVDIVIDGQTKTYGSGRGYNKKDAEKAAAKNALENLKQIENGNF